MAHNDTFVVGMSTHGSVMDGFLKSMLSLYVTDAYGARRIEAGRMLKVSGPYPAQNRSELCRNFLELCTADWLLLIDADHYFEPDAIYALIDSGHKTERPIVTASYWGYLGDDPQLRLVWYKWQDYKGFQPVEQIPEDILEIDICGMGCCAIHRSVLQKLRDERPEDEQAWFSHDSYYDNYAKRLKYFGEDFSFCIRAKQAGFTIWGNPHVEVDHLKVGRQNRHTIDVRLQYDGRGKSEPCPSLSPRE